MNCMDYSVRLKDLRVWGALRIFVFIHLGIKGVDNVEQFLERNFCHPKY